MVLFMSAVSDGGATVVRPRRRRGKTSTNPKSSRAPFSSTAVKDLPILEFIDLSNHFVNGVDQADQSQSYYKTQRTYMKNWKALWYFLLE